MFASKLYPSSLVEICSKQPCGYSRITGSPHICGSHGEVEIVMVKGPRPRLHASGIARRASNWGPLNEAATLSLRTIVGACTGIVISTASDICLFEFETASQRPVPGARSGSVIFALKRTTVGASRCADWVVTSPPSDLTFESVTHRVVTPS